MPKLRTRKLKIFPLTDEATLTLAGRIFGSQLPENCRILAVYANWQTKCVELLVEDDSFPEIEEGSVIPIEGILHA